MNPCEECGDTTGRHESNCQTGAEIFELQMTDAGVPGYVVDDDEEEKTDPMIMIFEE